MAKIGLRNFRYAFLTEAEDGTPSYAGAKTPGKAIDCEVSIENNNVKLRADDSDAEIDTSFSNGSVSITLDRADYQTHADLLGHRFENGVLTRNANDISPYVGLGRIVVHLEDNKRYYEVKILKKVKFSEPSQSDNTMGETIEFNTVQMEGSVAILKNGDWNNEKRFETYEEAIQYLEDQLGGAIANTYTVTYDLNGGTGTVDPVTVNAGDSITLDDGTGITVPSGKTSFLGWAKTASSTTATVTSPFTPDKDITLYAVYAD